MRTVGSAAFVLALVLSSFAQESKTLAQEPTPDLREAQHRFMDKTNLMLHSWNVAAETYDAVTTRRQLRGGRINELNPFGALFVNHGWGGQLAFSYGFGVGGPLLTSYMLHRTGHHKLERWVPVLNASGSTFAGSWNLGH